MEEFECALCHKTYPQHPGGQAGNYPLCHRDHKDGATCYEQVTRRHTFGQDFSVAIEQLQQMRHSSVAGTMRDYFYAQKAEALEDLTKKVKAYKYVQHVPRPTEFDMEITKMYAEVLGEPFLSIYENNRKVLEETSEQEH